MGNITRDSSTRKPLSIHRYLLRNSALRPGFAATETYRVCTVHALREQRDQNGVQVDRKASSLPRPGPDRISSPWVLLSFVPGVPRHHVAFGPRATCSMQNHTLLVSNKATSKHVVFTFVAEPHHPVPISSLSLRAFLASSHQTSELATYLPPSRSCYVPCCSGTG